MMLQRTLLTQGGTHSHGETSPSEGQRVPDLAGPSATLSLLGPSPDVNSPPWCPRPPAASPACSSFDMFRDYEERGRRFKAVVQGIMQENESKR